MVDGCLTSIAKELADYSRTWTILRRAIRAAGERDRATAWLPSRDRGVRRAVTRDT